MALGNWFSKRTPLQLALERGLTDGADLGGEIKRLGDFTIASRADAEAVCEALEKVKDRPKPATALFAPAHDLIALFQRVDGPECKAYAVFEQRGLPVLAEIVRTALAAPEEADRDSVLMALKLLALFQTEEGTDCVLAALRKPLYPDAHLWAAILNTYGPDHAQVDRLFTALGEKLPSGFAAVALLDAANGAKIGGAEDVVHPFDSNEGVARLEQYLTDDNPDHFSYAVSAAAALPFITLPQRDSLLALALDHADPNVQLEGAWAAARLGRDAGLRCLARYCLDFRHAARAMEYLRELERDDLIPPEATAPDAAALAEFAQWLAHPQELGRPPDELEIIDRRTLDWPVAGKRRQFWLIRFRAAARSSNGHDVVGVGLVGSTTSCLFDYQMHLRPPEDCYAIHCAWELESAGLLSVEPVPETSEAYDVLLEQWTGPLVEEAQMAY
ncbi:MAG: hypothetical protein NZO58_09645, partial [Gemmataceae bacterium]|nr:hypothetical protein [Gemmataceae bacterium]